MPSYVCRFFGRNGDLLAEEEFAQRSHVDAAYEARAMIRRAGIDIKGFELWSGGKLVASNMPRETKA